MIEDKKAKRMLVQEFTFDLEATKAMTKAGFIKSMNEQKEANTPLDGEGKKLKPKGRYARFDPVAAWDEMFPPKAK